MLGLETCEHVLVHCFGPTEAPASQWGCCGPTMGQPASPGSFATTTSLENRSECSGSSQNYNARPGNPQLRCAKWLITAALLVMPPTASSTRGKCCRPEALKGCGHKSWLSGFRAGVANLSESMPEIVARFPSPFYYESLYHPPSLLRGKTRGMSRG